MENIKSLRKRHNEIKTSFSANMEKYRKGLAEAEKQIESSNIALKNAIDSDEVDAFATAKAKVSLNEAHVEFYKNKLEHYSEKDLTSYDECRNALSVITQIENEIESKYANEVMSAIKDLKKKLDSYREEIKEAEQLYNDWNKTMAEYNPTIAKYVSSHYFEDNGLEQCLSGAVGILDIYKK